MFFQTIRTLNLITRKTLRTNHRAILYTPLLQERNEAVYSLIQIIFFRFCWRWCHQKHSTINLVRDSVMNRWTLVSKTARFPSSLDDRAWKVCGVWHSRFADSRLLKLKPKDAGTLRNYAIFGTKKFTEKQHCYKTRPEGSKYASFPDQTSFASCNY